MTHELSRDGIRVDIDDLIATVTLDRPPVNALTHEVYQDLGSIFTALSAATDDVRVCVLTASGRHFSAGRDFKAVTTATPEERFAAIGATLSAIRRCSAPVIAAVNGSAVGGGLGLVFACDLIVASRGSSFGWPEINFGLIGGMAGSRGILPPHVARRMYLTGEPMSPDRLYELGVVEAVVEPADLAAHARQLARVIAAKSPTALRAAKAAALEVETIVDREQAFRVVEARVAMAMTMSDGYAEAVRAFSRSDRHTDGSPA